MKIGLYDSGLGGLTILKAVRKRLPDYDYVYLGDTANLPYGDKSEEEIYTLAYDNIERLFGEGAQLVIVACNTISAATLRRLQDQIFNTKYPDRRVLGVIIPTMEVLHDMQFRKALLVGTKRTVASRKYDDELAKIDSEIELISVATPTLVSKIEDGALDGAITDLEQTIESLVGEVEGLVLGCTHYTLLKEMIREKYPQLAVISQDEIIPEKCADYLKRHPEIESTLTRTGKAEVLLTKETPRYAQIKQTFLTV